jgi:hypothetical protein
MPEPRRGQHRRELRLRSHERRAFARAAARTSRHRREDLKDDYGKLDSQGCIDALDAFFVCLTLTECAELMREDSTACKVAAGRAPRRLPDGRGRRRRRDSTG